jgi:hypothetical protein
MKTLSRARQIALAGSALLTILIALASFFSVIQLALR